MAVAPLSLTSRSAEIRKSGKVVGTTDRVYDVTTSEVEFEEVVVEGDLTGNLDYNGHAIKIVRIDATIGLIEDDRGVRGPVWKGVVCEVVSISHRTPTL